MSESHVLLDVKFCPVCGAKLHVDDERLLCERCGEMKVYLERDPGVSVGKDCDALGVMNLEAK